MSCEDGTMQALRESGHRPTPQRLMVASAVRHADSHVTAGEILQQVKSSYPYIDVSTIYRTLNVLKEIRLISETDMGGGESSYEWIELSKHHHLVCRSCDGVTLLDHRHLQELSAGILKDYGFRADVDHFAILGVCKECREKRGRSTATQATGDDNGAVTGSLSEVNERTG